MQPSRPLAALITAAALAAAPSAALAQDGRGALPNLTPTPRTPKPPVQRPAAPSHASDLPETGADARVLALVGLSLLLTGAGLRMRTAVERF